ncbi:MAG: glycoside hydrolase family 27 protein [Flavobacteriales bacterium]|nr:glycoside hydrolase family 27 protein [Flavobacteriales bacterium]
MIKKIAFLLSACVFSLCANAQKYEELALTPQMGWSTWNCFAGNIDENMAREMADAMVQSGLRDAGYIYLNIDDCWHGKRDSLGFITSDPVRFPSGIKALADYVHSKGLKLGIYSDAGRKTCAGMPGSFGHEYQDALTYARWEVDYLKYDWCESENINAKGAYTLMRDALRAAGRPILFSMCEWGDNKPWEWAAQVGHSWRTTGDIYNNFDGIDDRGDWKAFGVMQILDMQDTLRKYAGPGHWNDPDMLEVGNGQSVNEDRAHFTMWCMLSAPLILGNDIRKMSQQTKDIIMNKEVIAIDQDSLGVQGLKAEANDGVEVWLKPLKGGDWALCVLNRSTEVKSYELNWQRFNIYDEVSKRHTGFYNTVYSVRNLWTKKSQGNTKKDVTLTIPAHDVVLYRLSVLKK